MRFKIYGSNTSADRTKIKVGSLIQFKDNSFVYQVSQTNFGDYNFINLSTGNRFLSKDVDFFELCKNESFEHIILGALILLPDDYVFSVGERVEILSGQFKGYKGTVKSIGLTVCDINILIGNNAFVFTYGFHEIMPAFD